jgi:hypothetical protein
LGVGQGVEEQKLLFSLGVWSEYLKQENLKSSKMKWTQRLFESNAGHTRSRRKESGEYLDFVKLGQQWEITRS